MAEAPLDANRLCTAAARGQCGEVRRILQSNNVGANARNKFGRTALQVMKMGCPRVAEVLLLSNANPNLCDPVKGLTIAHDAAREGHTDTLEVLVNYGADVNLQDRDGNLPLHLAAREGHLSAVRLLALHTAHPVPRNCEGLTPLDLARAHRREDTARWLQSYTPPQLPQPPQPPRPPQQP